MDPQTIEQVLQNINNTYYLPGIQRTYDWEEEDIEKLFDSILRDIPIGNINTWVLTSSDSKFDDQFYYEFIENHIADGLNPFTVDEVDGSVTDVFGDDLDPEQAHPVDETPTLAHVNRQLDGPPSNTPTAILVIDGQQRLTSLYIGLFGSIVDYKANKSRKKVENWGQKYLYLNLAADSEAEDARDMRYEFRFKWADDDLPVTENQYWFRVCDLVHRDEANIPFKRHASIDSFIEGHITDAYDENDADLSDDLKETIRMNLTRLKNALMDVRHGYDIQSILTQMNGSRRGRNRVKRSFFRLNDEGSPVSSEQKLLSHAILNWAYTDEAAETGDEADATEADSDGSDTECPDRFNPREEVFDLISEFNSEYSDANGRSHFEIDLKGVFQSLSGISRAEARPDHKLDEAEMDVMKDCWQGTGEQSAFEDTLFEVYDALAEMGITERTGLSGKHAIIPILYFAHHNDVDLLTRTNQRRIKKYLLSATVGDVLSSKGSWVDDALAELESQSYPSTADDESAADDDEPVEGDADEVEEPNLDTFPYEDVVAAVNHGSNTKRLEPVRDEMVARLDGIRYNTKRARFVLSHLRDRFTTNTQPEVDHIFPQALFTDDVYDELGLDDDAREAYDALQDSIWNLELLRESVHDTKSNWYENNDPSLGTVAQWIQRTEEDELDAIDAQVYRDTHDIPDDESLYTFARFLDFVRERREEMLDDLLGEYNFELTDIETDTVNEFDLDALGPDPNTDVVTDGDADADGKTDTASDSEAVAD